MLKLVGEVQSAERKSSSLTQRIHGLDAENCQLRSTGQDVLRRYEEESARRLELEERCLALEEAARVVQERAKEDADAAKQREKRNLLAKQRADELCHHRDEKEKAAVKRAEEAEARSRTLEFEVQRLKAVSTERARRLDAQVASHRGGFSSGAVSAERPNNEVGQNCSKKLAPASCPRPVSRPCTACSVQDGTSPARVHHSMSPSSSLVRGSVKDEVTQYARRPPGAIRRGVSLPARRSPGASGSSRGPNEWKLSLMPRLPEQMDTMSTGAVTALQGTQGLRSGAKPMRPGSNSALADHEIENVIPGDSGGSSDDGDEVLSPVRPCGAGG